MHRIAGFFPHSGKRVLTFPDVDFVATNDLAGSLLRKYVSTKWVASTSEFSDLADEIGQVRMHPDLVGYQSDAEILRRTVGIVFPDRDHNAKPSSPLVNRTPPPGAFPTSPTRSIFRKSIDNTGPTVPTKRKLAQDALVRLTADVDDYTTRYIQILAAESAQITHGGRINPDDAARFRDEKVSIITNVRGAIFSAVQAVIPGPDEAWNLIRLETQLRADQDSAAKPGSLVSTSTPTGHANIAAAADGEDQILANATEPDILVAAVALFLRFHAFNLINNQHDRTVGNSVDRQTHWTGLYQDLFLVRRRDEFGPSTTTHVPASARPSTPVIPSGSQACPNPPLSPRSPRSRKRLSWSSCLASPPSPPAGRRHHRQYSREVREQQRSGVVTPAAVVHLHHQHLSGVLSDPIERLARTVSLAARLESCQRDCAGSMVENLWWVARLEQTSVVMKPYFRKMREHGQDMDAVAEMIESAIQAIGLCPAGRV